MSYILDALKKSERERSGVRAGDTAGDGTETHARSPWPLAVALVIASNALLAFGWWAWQRGAEPPTTNAPATPFERPTAPPTSIAPAIEPAPTEVPTIATGKTAVGDLAAETLRAPAPTPRVRAEARPLHVSPTVLSPTPTSPIDDGAQPVVAHPAAAASVPWLRELPASFRTAVAPLNVNIHVFAGSSEDSVLYINDRQYRTGETLPNGVRLDAVVADGAVLSYQGQQFKLPRPN